MNNKKDLDNFDPQERNRIVARYVNHKILLDEASRSKIQDSDVYKKQLQLAKDGMSVNLFLNHYAKRQLTDSKLKAEYNNFVKALKDNDQLNVSHILVKSETEAVDILKKIKSGEMSFENAAKKYSLEGNAKESGGQIGLISKGMTVPEFEKAVYSLKKNNIYL